MPDYMESEYLDWLIDFVCGSAFSENIRYIDLLTHLHSVKFKWRHKMDKNRASDGIDLRARFYPNYDYTNVAPCTVLEMMVALAIRCEESLMDDAKYGDRTKQWFWSMVSSLGLKMQFDDYYDYKYVDDTIVRFLNGDYEPNGRGGLFTINRCEDDLRDVEIWTQLSWYINRIA